MSKSTVILDLIDSYVENHVLMCSAIKDTGEQSAESIGYIEKSIDIREKLLAVADRQDRLLVWAKFFARTQPNNDLIKLIAECEGKDE